MAKKTVVVSDLTGAEIDDKQYARVTISFSEPAKGTIVLDVNAGEIKELTAAGRQQARRGRKPAAVS